jgi:hypothetical protein
MAYGMMMKMGLFILLLVLPLTSCDTFYGIHREATIAVQPDLDEIARAIRRVDGIDRVRSELHGETRVFFYSGPNSISGRVFLTEEKPGRNVLGVHFIRSNVIPPQDVIDRNYSIMLKVEEQIEKQCGLIGFCQSLKETSSARMKHSDALPTSSGSSTIRPILKK